MKPACGKKLISGLGTRAAPHKHAARTSGHTVPYPSKIGKQLSELAIYTPTAQRRMRTAAVWGNADSRC
jgi:hypothetical protein